MNTKRIQIIAAVLMLVAFALTIGTPAALAGPNPCEVLTEQSTPAENVACSKYLAQQQQATFDLLSELKALMSGGNTLPPQQPSAQQPTDLGVLEIDATHPWPQANPFPASKAVEVDVCQYGVGLYEPAGTTRWFDLSQPDGYDLMVVGCITGKAWFKDMAPTGTVFMNTAIPAGSSTATGDCAKLAGRNARLDCASTKYFDVLNAGGTKLAATEAMLVSMGVHWDHLELASTQPDAYPAVQGQPRRLWGALVKGVNLTVTGNTCLVNDVPATIETSGWHYTEPANLQQQDAPDSHYGEAATASGQLVEQGVHLDCTDWPEIVGAMTAAGYTPLQ